MAGGAWHTHPDLIGYRFSVSEKEAIQFFVNAIVSDQLPILFKACDGQFAEAWVSNNLSETLRLYGKDEWGLRLWSGTEISVDQALKIDANVLRAS